MTDPAVIQCEAEITQYDNAIAQRATEIDRLRAEVKTFVKDRDALMARVAAAKKVAAMSETEREAVKRAIDQAERAA